MSPIRRVAALAALALTSTSLTAAGVVLAASPAGAATAASFDWQVSQQFTEHLSGHVLGDGATEAAGVVTFPGGEGSFDPETGAGTIQYDGSVAGSFAVVGTTYYTVTIADPAVTVDADGEGTISALVSASNAAAMGNPAESTEPARVTVTTFDADGGWGAGSITATPDWAGVLPEGEESAALGIGAGKPVDGKSFAPEFLGQVTSGTRAHFYASGAVADAKKAPATFTAGAVETGSEKTVDAATSYGANGVTVDVTGGGFTATDGNPGDDGVYIGLAAAGGMPDVDDREDMDKFAAVNWVPGSAIADGSFASSMTAKAADLDRGTAYAVYTWRAHTHSSTSQDTETPLTINWSKLKSPVKLKVALTKKPTTKKAGKLAVDAGSATGKVTVKLSKKGKAGPTRSAKLKKGKARLTLPKLAKGTWKATVSYPGTSAYKAASKTLVFKV